MDHETLIVEHAPAQPGLRFRRFRGASDFPALAAVLTASENADGLERLATAEDLAAAYQNLKNCDPYQDLLLAEVAGEVVGYARGWWWEETSVGQLYGLSGFLVPAWRRQGLGRALLLWLEARLRVVAAAQPSGPARFFQADAAQLQTGKAALLERAGYQPVRYFHDMVRPTLEAIPAWPLPAGLAVRPVTPEHYRALWDSLNETSQDEWGHTQPTEDGYQAWLAHPHFQPSLWQVAWDTAADRIAGHVLTFIDHDENRQFERRRGYTEGIGVARPWRRRGVARALIAHSLQAQKAAGMAESALTADRQSANDATRLYESCGFRVVWRNAIYRKPL